MTVIVCFKSFKATHWFWIIAQGRHFEHEDLLFLPLKVIFFRLCLVHLLSNTATNNNMYTATIYEMEVMIGL